MYHLLALLTVCVWGTTFVSTKVLLAHGLTPSGIFLLRFALAYAGMLAVTRRPRRCASWRDEALMLLAGLTGGSLYFLTENTALRFAQAGNVSLLVSLAPVATVLLALLMGRRRGGSSRPPRRLWVGMVLSLVGVSLVVSGEPVATATRPLLGGALALAGALLWAVYQNIAPPLSRRYGVRVLTRKVFGYGLLTLLLLHLLAEPLLPASGGAALASQFRTVLAEPAVWANLLFLGIVASWLCYLVWNTVVERLGAVVSANYIYLNPLTTCLFSALFLGERFTPAMALGAVAILSGVYIAVGWKAKNREKGA